jgi:mono/diheme cytochrome c family protein
MRSSERALVVSRSERTTVVVAGALLVLALACTGPAAPPHSRSDRLAEGARLFQRHCAPCHGSGAHGDGPVAPHLQTPPLDLTQIAQRRAGRFDVDEITTFIDGRMRVAAHGAPDMPVWGRAFDAGFGGGGNPIPLLVGYLESIQVGTQERSR